MSALENGFKMGVLWTADKFRKGIGQNRICTEAKKFIDRSNLASLSEIEAIDAVFLEILGERPQGIPFSPDDRSPT